MTPSCLCLVPFFPPLYVIITLSITFCPPKDLVSGSRCMCPPGFSGKYCQIGASPCDSAPCLHGGQCMEKDGRTITCNCPPGYSGIFCEVGQLSWCQCGVLSIMENNVKIGSFGTMSKVFLILFQAVLKRRTPTLNIGTNVSYLLEVLIRIRNTTSLQVATLKQV